MAKRVTISDDLADLLEKKREADGLPSLDAAAERVLRYTLREEELTPYTVEELSALIAEGEEGPAEPWDPVAVRAEVLRRYAERKNR